MATGRATFLKKELADTLPEMVFGGGSAAVAVVL
jgi:hypothetical protein